MAPTLNMSSGKDEFWIQAQTCSFIVRYDEGATRTELDISQLVSVRIRVRRFDVEKQSQVTTTMAP